MASFPTEWSVYDELQFASYTVTDLHDAPLGMNMLVKLGADGRSLGIYKISLFGGGTMEARYPISQILHECPPLFANLMLVTSYTASQVAPMTNSTTVPWRDLDVLLSEKSAFLADAQGAIINPTLLIDYLQALRADKSNNGASIRWAVAASNQRRMQLEFQTLPAHSKSLTKANLRGDNAVSVLLGSFPVNADLFSGPIPTGPVPLFFAPDRERTSELIIQHPDQLCHDIAAINNQILVMEHLTLQEAHAYLQGRARAAKGTPAFPVTSGPPAKRPRLQTTATTGTGRICNIYLINSLCIYINFLVLIYQN